MPKQQTEQLGVVSERTDLEGKVTVLVVLRNALNKPVRGNRMRVFSVSGQTVTHVADAIAPVIDGLRKHPRMTPAPKKGRGNRGKLQA